MYMAASINLVGQKEQLTGQMPKLAGKCPVTDCYYEHCSICTINLFPSTMEGVGHRNGEGGGGGWREKGWRVGGGGGGRGVGERGWGMEQRCVAC